MLIENELSIFYKNAFLWDPADCKTASRDTLSILGKKTHLSKPEKVIREKLNAYLESRNGVKLTFPQNTKIFAGRTDSIFSQIKPWIFGKRVLDIGGGSGHLAKKIQCSLDVETAILETVPQTVTGIKTFRYKNGKAPFPDKHFDSGLLVTVMHHSSNPLYLLRESMRISKRVIVVETVVEEKSDLSLYSTMFLDWFYNKILINPEIETPGNFLDAASWKIKFQELGCKLIHESPLPEIHRLIRLKHWLFTLE